MATSTDGPVLGDIPYRIRIGLAGPVRLESMEAARTAIRERLLQAILGLLADPARPRTTLPRTPVRYQVLTRESDDGERFLAATIAESDAARVESVIPDGLDHLAQRINLVVQLEPPGGARAEDALVALARRRGLPIVTLVPFAVERGRGLNAAAFERLDQFNTARLARQDVDREIGNVWCGVFDTDEGRRLSRAALDAVRDHLLIPWARADLLARRYQTGYRRAGQAVWILFPIAVAAVALGALYPSAGVIAFPAQAVLLLVMLLVVWFADRDRSLERWVEHRLLAERLRVAAFMRAAGFEAGSFETPPHLARAGRSEWINVAFNELHARMPPVALMPAGDPAAVRAFVARRWVGAQRAFHADRAAHHLRWSRRLERSGHLVFLFAILIAMGHTIFALGWAHGDAVEPALLFLGLVLPGAGAALGGFRAHREYSRIAKRSDAMAGALAALEQHLESPEPEARLEEHLGQVEQAIIGEVQDWVVLMRVATVQPVG